MPLLWISLEYLAGILIGKWLVVPIWGWVAASVVFILSFVIGLSQKHKWWRKYFSVAPALLMTAFALGGLRLSVSTPVFSSHSLAAYNDQGSVKLTGWVSDPPDARESGVYLRLSIVEMEKPDKTTGEMTTIKASGDCLVKFPAGVSYKMGDLLQFTAEPLTPAGSSDFSYRDYLSRQGIYSVAYFPQSVRYLGIHPVNPLRIWLENLRQNARKTIFTLFPQPESGLLSGILLGLDNDLPESLQNAYRDTGTAHIIAISGFNMAILAGLLMLVSSKIFNRYLGMIMTAIGLGLYTILVGASPSVVRAAFMAIIAMSGHLIGRRSTGVNALFLTAAVMLMVNPQLLWDASFQLSFAATLGLVLFATPLQTWLEELLGRHMPEEQVHRTAGPVSEYFLFTMAAQIATLPVIALQFRRLSVSSMLSNPLVLPIQPAVLIAGGLTTFFGMIFEPLGRLGAFVAWPLLAYTNRMVSWIANAAGESIAISRSLALGIAVFCGIGLLLFVFRAKVKKVLGRISHAWVILLLMAAVVSVWAAVLHRPDGKFHMEIVRSGDETDLVMTSPHGGKVVVNPGEGVNELSSFISQSLSPWRNSISAVLFTDRKSVKNLSALNERLPIRQAFLSPPLTHPMEGIPPILVDPAIPTTNLALNDTLMIDDSVHIQAAAADRECTALLIEYQNCRILIPGGIDPALLRQANLQKLSGLTAIILTPDDLAYVPASWWERFHAEIIFWQDLSAPPVESWIQLNGSSSIELLSNGELFSIFTR